MFEQSVRQYIVEDNDLLMETEAKKYRIVKILDLVYNSRIQVNESSFILFHIFSYFLYAGNPLLCFCQYFHFIPFPSGAVGTDTVVDACIWFRTLHLPSP